MTRRRSLHLLALTAVLGTVGSLGSIAHAEPLRQVILVDEPFKCGRYDQPLDLDLVKVTMTEEYDRQFNKAVALSGKCNGRIGRIEVDTAVGDGVMVGKGAQNLTIQSGYIRCSNRRLAASRKHDMHQDGVQALGGIDVTFRGVSIDCPSANNAAFFLTRGAGGADTPTVGDWPTRVVCDGCTFSAPGQLVAIHASISSGARNSFFACKPKHFRVRTTDAAVDPVNDNNQLLSHEPCPKPMAGARRGGGTSEASSEEPREGKRHEGGRRDRARAEGRAERGERAERQGRGEHRRHEKRSRRIRDRG